MDKKIRTITPYAEKLLSRLPRTQSPTSTSRQHLTEWVNTAEASELSGYSRRQIQTLCDTGFLIEGEDWKQRRPRPGGKQGGLIRIRRSALQKL
jgi:hypothetical protein